MPQTTAAFRLHCILNALSTPRLIRTVRPRYESFRMDYCNSVFRRWHPGLAGFPDVPACNGRTGAVASQDIPLHPGCTAGTGRFTRYRLAAWSFQPQLVAPDAPVPFDQFGFRCIVDRGELC